MLKKIILYIILLLSVTVGVQAQTYNIYVRNEKGVPMGGIKVFTFLRQSVAKEAFAQATSELNNPNTVYGYGSFDENKYSPIAEDKTDADGLCVIAGSSEGSIILDGYDLDGYGAMLFHIKDCKVEADNTLNLILKGTAASEEKKSIEERVTKMKTVPAYGSIPMESAGGGVERHGRNNILIKRDVDIDGEQARTDGRFVIFPTIIYEDFKDSVVYMPPMAVDGLEFSRGMLRRSGFKASNDLLAEFVYDASTHLESHQSERVTYAQWARIEKGTSYHIPGVIWYEDFNGVYHRDSILVSDGKEREPMRFLNWEEARKFAALDTTLGVFRRKGTVSSVPVDKNFKLTFEQGRATLNLSDSATNSQREGMMDWLNAYYSNRNAMITGITVRAYSSPEGSEARNRALSRERAATIRQLLAGRFREIKNIGVEFDEYDNVVPWETVADSMSLMSDTVARRYAEEIRAITTVHSGFDAQYRAIRAKADLYDYVDKKVLDKVRQVSVSADIIEQTVLSRAQIVDRYYNEPGFIDAIRPYQAYELLCYLAAEEKWDELYEVSKYVYNFHNRERRVDKQVLKPGSENELTFIRDQMVPYPLASYYYAISCMRRGEVNKDILKPHLDDGRISTAGPRYESQGMNLMAFIVAQVLMCCQDESFDEANALIKKYNLITIPELKGLIMFVRCLDGQYSTSEEVRQYVMSTSPMNRAVILTAMGKYDEALTVLYTGDIPADDAKAEYLRAICLFRKQVDAFTRFEAESLPASALYEEEDDYDDADEESTDKNTGIPSTWAVPMLNSFKLDESNIDYLRADGYFNNAYRQMVFYAWERMKDGVSLERISKEYAALVAKMKKDKEKVN